MKKKIFFIGLIDVLLCLSLLLAGCDNLTGNKTTGGGLQGMGKGNGKSDGGGGGTVTSVPGESSSNAITLPTDGNPKEGNFISGKNEVWYKFTYNGDGVLYGYDSEYNSSLYNSDIVVDVLTSSLAAVNLQGGGNLNNLDIGVYPFESGKYIRLENWNGTYYVKVKPYNGNSSNKGNFALIFYKY